MKEFPQKEWSRISLDPIIKKTDAYDTNDSSGVAGTLAARGGCQICRPSIVDFGNWSLFMSAAMSTVTLLGLSYSVTVYWHKVFVLFKFNCNKRI